MIIINFQLGNFFPTRNSHNNFMTKKKIKLYCKEQLVYELMDLKIKIFKNANEYILMLLKRLGSKFSGF